MSRDRSHEQPLVSLVVPVYQVLQYVDACVGSLLAQTYQNIEMILVDDGSTDGSGDKCDQWGQQDERVRVFHTANRGLSQARNRGIDESRGEYLIFVDSDDVVAGNFVECLLGALTTHRADVAMTGIEPFVSAPPDFDQGCPEAVVESSDDALVRIAKENRGWEACGKLYRADAFSTLRFAPDLLYEDLDLIPRLLGTCGSIATLERPLYGYRVRDTSIMGSSKRRMSKDLLTILDRHIRESMGINEPRRSALVAAYIVHASGRLMKMDPHYIRDNQEFISAYRTFVISHIGEVFSNPEFRLRKRLEVLSCAVYPAGMIRAKHFRRLKHARSAVGSR